MYYYILYVYCILYVKQNMVYTVEVHNNLNAVIPHGNHSTNSNSIQQICLLVKISNFKIIFLNS